jgi:hypothetical protein
MKMKRRYFHGLFLLISIGSLIVISCNKPPYEPDYYMATGFVIGKEVCNTDTTKDYWLINIISSSSRQQQYGDTVLLNGITYTNVVKTSGLPKEMMKVGTKIGMDFYLSKEKRTTTGCTSSSPIIFYLKVADIVNIGWAA